MQRREYHTTPIARSPRPEPFIGDTLIEYRRRLELMGLALDEAVEAYLCVSAQEVAATDHQLRRISAAARRLSERAHSLARVLNLAPR